MWGIASWAWQWWYPHWIAPSNALEATANYDNDCPLVTGEQESWTLQLKCLTICSVWRWWRRRLGSQSRRVHHLLVAWLISSDCGVSTSIYRLTPSDAFEVTRIVVLFVCGSWMNQECNDNDIRRPAPLFCHNSLSYTALLYLLPTNNQMQFKSRMVLPKARIPKTVGKNFHISGIQDEDIDVSWKSLVNTAQRQAFSTYMQCLFVGVSYLKLIYVTISTLPQHIAISRDHPRYYPLVIISRNWLTSFDNISYDYCIIMFLSCVVCSFSILAIVVVTSSFIPNLMNASSSCSQDSQNLHHCDSYVDKKSNRFISECTGLIVNDDDEYLDTKISTTAGADSNKNPKEWQRPSWSNIALVSLF